MNTKKRERQLQHRDALEQIKGQLAAEEATYGREEDQLPWGPLADPSWFPSSGEVDEEEIFVFQKVSLVKLFNQWTSQRGRNDFEVLDAEESVALRSYLEGFVQREKELKKYNIMEVSFYKGFLLPREPYLRKNEEDQRIERHPRIWWLPKDVMQERLSSEGVWLGEYAPLDSNFIANPSGQRLVIESHTLDFLPQLFGRVKLGDQPAGWCYWLDEPQEGWEMFASAVRRDGFFQRAPRGSPMRPNGIGSIWTSGTCPGAQKSAPCSSASSIWCPLRCRGARRTRLEDGSGKSCCRAPRSK